MTRALVTGAAGMVGSYAPVAFEGWELTLTDVVEGFEQLDVADRTAVAELVRKMQPDLVVHLAAATDVDRCEQEPDFAFRANAIGTQNVALACRDAGAVLVYASTGAVFSGDREEPYTEYDETSPSNVYAHSKLAGERTVESLLDRFVIARAGWMIGGGQKDKKFVGKIVAQVDEGQTQLRAVDDKFGTPTYARDFLDGIRLLVEEGLYGVYHLGNPGMCSRFDIAREIASILGRDDIEVSAVSSSEFPLPAPRGRSEAIRNFKWELLGLPARREWREALAAYVHGELRGA